MESKDKKVLHRSLLVLLAVVALFVLVLIFTKQKGTPLDSFAETFTGQAIVNVNGANLVAAVADTPWEREKGLSGSTSLNDKSAMFFVFEEADEHGFWMKDMNMPIDIIWIDESNRIVDIRENISPDTYPQVFKPSAPAKYVLEVNAGYVDRNGIAIGDTIMVTDIVK